MAQIATLAEPYTLGAIDEVAEIPVGDLIEPYVVGLPDLMVPPVLGNRFPTPPAAFAFLVDPLVELDPPVPMTYDAIGPPYVIVGALSPAGPYLEPTIGQIWPRTG
jgi:hypothetical protein